MTQYRTIVADPPWQFGDKLPGKNRGAERNYPTLSVQQIIDCYRLRQEGMLADDARLFLWRVSSMQVEAIMVMQGWGFELKSEMVWVKETPKGKLWFGMGRQVRNSHEVCLIGVRGRPERLSRSVRSVFMAPYSRHSGKPEVFFDIVESLSPGPYLELFARRQRKGWSCLGNELDELC